MLLALKLSPYDMWNEISMLSTAKLAIYSLYCSALTNNSFPLSLSPSSAEPGFPADSWGPQFIFPHKGREKPVVQQANCQQELLQDCCMFHPNWSTITGVLALTNPDICVPAAAELRSLRLRVDVQQMMGL